MIHRLRIRQVDAENNKKPKPESICTTSVEIKFHGNAGVVMSHI